MSKHLIQTVLATTDYSTRYCIKHGATTPKWRTISLYRIETGNIVLSGAEDDDSWESIFDPIQGSFVGEILFGTCCLWKATVLFHLEEDPGDYFGSVTINDTLVSQFGIPESPGETVSIEVDMNALGLMNNACGCQWSIFISGNGIAPKITVEITDVTFGPPV